MLQSSCARSFQSVYKYHVLAMTDLGQAVPGSRDTQASMTPKESYSLRVMSAIVKAANSG